MEESQIVLPSVDDYVRAFRAVEEDITDNQRRMLVFHHAQPARAVSARTLAVHVGWKDYSAANLQYGLLADRVARELGIALGEHARVGVLVEFVYPQQAANTEFLWIMRERVALALEELEWVPRVSHYLYPDLALKAAMAG